MPTPEQQNNLTPEKYWEMLDGKIKQEVGWIQQRMSWLATFHGFLFATFGLTYKIRIDAGANGADSASSELILNVIALVGLLTCLCIMAGLWAASDVLKTIEKEWKRLVPCQKDRDRFPSIRTANPKIRFVGMLSSWGPSILFLLAWTFLLYYMNSR